MKLTDIHTILDGRVDMSNSERHIETTSYIQTKNNLKHVGLDMADRFAHRLLDQRSAL